MAFVHAIGTIPVPCFGAMVVAVFIAIVGGPNHDGVFGKLELLQGRNDASDVAIMPRHQCGVKLFEFCKF